MKRKKVVGLDSEAGNEEGFGDWILNASQGITHLVLAIVPLMYVLGFVIWSRHNLDYQLGWISAPTDRYLAIGFLGLILAAFICAAVSLSIYLVHKLKGRLAQMMALVLLAPVLGGLAFGSFFMLLAKVGAAFRSDNLVEPAATMGAIATLIGASVGYAASWLKAKRQPRVRESRRPMLAKGSILAISLIIVPFMPSFQEQITSEFGGLAPSWAQFELSPEGMSPILSQALTARLVNITGDPIVPVLTTVPLLVFSKTDEGYLVRRVGYCEGALIEIPYQSIQSVIWLNNPWPMEITGHSSDGRLSASGVLEHPCQ